MQSENALLVVDRDPRLHRLYRDIFPQFPISSATSGREALCALPALAPALVLLDLNLPDIDGIVLVTKIRWRGYPTPIMVTGAGVTRTDTYLALKLGADDVVSKPFDVDELQARVCAVLRRSTRPPSPDNSATFAGLVLSPGGAATFNGRTFQLSPTEHRVLSTLAVRQGECCSSSDLVEMIGYEAGLPGTDHLLDNNVYRLRRRLKALGPDAPRIVTVRRSGYCLAEGDSSL